MKTSMKSILVTGAAGYIGSVLVRKLLSRGYYVRGMDILKFGGESLISIYNHPKFEFIRGDIKREEDIQRALKDIEGIVHLAAIVGEPACSRDYNLTTETNWEGSKLLFELSRNSGRIKKFIFASTCSNYGKMEEKEYMDETSRLCPLSHYAELKVKFEEYLLGCSVPITFFPVVLRFSTVFGLSPRPRFDLTVNHFTKDAVKDSEICIYGGQFWRPYCHVQDIARACIIVLESEGGKIDHEVFGVGATTQNYQKKTIAEEICRQLPDINLKYISERMDDPRNYRVNFSKIHNILGFETKINLTQGIAEIRKVLEDKVISNPDDTKYRNS